MTLLAVAVAGRGVVPPDEPVVQADDEALLRGRAAFETLRVYGGKPFRLADHLARMRFSAERLDIAWTGGFEALAEEALAAAGAEDAVLRLYLTPGRERSGRPVSLALVSSLPDDLEERRGRGIKLISLLGVRAEAPWLLGGVKSTSYAVNMAAEAEARARGADDAVFVRDDGVVLEGPVTNVWWRRGSTLCTPSLDLGILAGVTRAVMIEAAPAAGYEIAEGTYPLGEVLSAEEAFTTSSVREVMPVVELDGTGVRARPGGGRAPGGVTEGGRSVKQLVFRTMNTVHGGLYRMSGGKMGGTMRGVPILLLQTRGRKSGKEYTTPLMFGRDGDNLVLIASKGGDPRNPAWYHNLQAGEAEVQIGHEHLRVRARDADGRRARTPLEPDGRPLSGVCRVPEEDDPADPGRRARAHLIPSRRAPAARSSCSRARRTPPGGSR